MACVDSTMSSSPSVKVSQCTDKRPEQCDNRSGGDGPRILKLRRQPCAEPFGYEDRFIARGETNIVRMIKMATLRTLRQADLSHRVSCRVLPVKHAQRNYAVVR